MGQKDREVGTEEYTNKVTTVKEKEPGESRGSGTTIYEWNQSNRKGAHEYTICDPWASPHPGGYDENRRRSK